MRLQSLAVLSLLVLSTPAMAEPEQLAPAPSAPPFYPVEVSAPALMHMADTHPAAQHVGESAGPVEVSLGEVVKLAAKAISSRNWGLLACALVLGVVYVVRRIGAARLPWLRSDAAGVGLSLLVAAALQLSSTMAAGTPLTPSMVIGTLVTAAGASGLFSWGRKLRMAGQAAGSSSQAE